MEAKGDRAGSTQVPQSRYLSHKQHTDISRTSLIHRLQTIISFKDLNDRDSVLQALTRVLIEIQDVELGRARRSNVRTSFVPTEFPVRMLLTGSSSNETILTMKHIWRRKTSMERPSIVGKSQNEKRLQEQIQRQSEKQIEEPVGKKGT